MICVLVLAAGASWESAGVTALGAAEGIVVLKRCMDADDLLAAAAMGQADVVLVAMEAPGLDASLVEHLRRQQVRVIAVAPIGVGHEAAQSRATRIGIGTLISAHDPAAMVAAVRNRATASETGTAGAEVNHQFDHPVFTVQSPEAMDVVSKPFDAFGDPALAASNPGRIFVIWGPGAPGRTTLATAIAGDLAGRGKPTTLVDADPHGPSVAQHLGIVDEASGVLTAGRLVTSGMLPERLGTTMRALAGGLRVVTGLPRADRWSEVRTGSMEALLEALRQVGHVVVDTGASIEEDGVDFGSRPSRNAMTLGALSVADEILVVGAADPIGLSRLARGLVDLRSVVAGTPIRVLINRQRRTIGWQESEIAAMIGDFSRINGLHFLPDDQAGVDRALIAGKSVTESGDTTLRRAVAQTVDALLWNELGQAANQRRAFGLRRRRAGTGHRR